MTAMQIGDVQTQSDYLLLLSATLTAARLELFIVFHAPGIRRLNEAETFKVIAETKESVLIVDDSVTRLEGKTQARVLRDKLYPSQRALSILADVPYLTEADPSAYDVADMLKGVDVLERDADGEFVVFGTGIDAVPPLREKHDGALPHVRSFCSKINPDEIDFNQFDISNAE